MIAADVVLQVAAQESRVGREPGDESWFDVARPPPGGGACRRMTRRAARPGRDARRLDERTRPMTARIATAGRRSTGRPAGLCPRLAPMPSPSSAGENAKVVAHPHATQLASSPRSLASPRSLTLPARSSVRSGQQPGVRASTGRNTSGQPTAPPGQVRKGPGARFQETGAGLPAESAVVHGRPPGPAADAPLCG